MTDAENYDKYAQQYMALANVYLAIWKFPSRRPRCFTTDKSFAIDWINVLLKVKYKVICVVLFKQT